MFHSFAKVAHPPPPSGIPSWVLVSGSGDVATWDADYAGNQFWADGVEYNNIAAFFAAFGVTFTRGSTATYVDSAGIVRISNINTPRLTFDPDTLAPLGFMNEEARLNLVENSRAFEAASWDTVQNATVTDNSAIAPDGTMTACLFEATGSSNMRVMDQFPTPGVPGVASVFVKKVNNDQVKVGFTPSTSNATIFTFSTESLVDGINVTSSSFERFPDDWYRITVHGAGDNLEAMDIRSNASNVAGDAYHIWGAGAEAGDFPTSHIPTSGGTFTRSAERCEVTFDNAGTDEPFKNWNIPAGSMYAEYQHDGLLGLQKYGFSIIGPVDNDLDAIFLRTKTDGTSEFFTAKIAGNGGDTSFAAAITANTKAKSAVSWKVDDIAYSLNGATVDTDITADIPILTRMLIGSRQLGERNLNGTLARQAYWIEDLINADLETLSIL